MRQGRLRPYLGYTLAELLIVVSIIGILGAVAMPRFRDVRGQANVNSAMARLTRGVIAARQASIQRGRRSMFRNSNSKYWVILDTTGAWTDSVIVVPVQDVVKQYGVEITMPSGVTSIEYDPRGISTQASKKTFVFKHTSTNKMDSLCVSKLGNTIKRVCP